MKPISLLEKIVDHTLGVITYDLDNQRPQILCCTAHAMTGSSGGLRSKSDIWQ